MADLHPTQQAAVDDCCDMTKRLVAVTGQAGTGKTTIIKEVAARLSADHKHLVAIAAPTGKAARRIREATGFDAVTIHKLLEYNKPEIDQNTGKALHESGPSRHRSNQLEHHVIIVDEYAMVSWTLHRNIVDAMRAGAVLRVFGDVSQLPPIDNAYPVGEDNTPFEACLKKPNSHTLTEVFRQADDSDVLIAAGAIKLGRFPSPGKQYTQKLTDMPVDRLIEHVNESGINYASLENQIITPGRKSWVGTIALNGLLQRVYNDEPSNSLLLPRHKWDKQDVIVGIGDKVVCTENTYDMRDYTERYEEFDEKGEGLLHTFIPPLETKTMLNGEVGIVYAIRPDGTLEIDFSDRIAEVPPKYFEVWQGKAFERDPRKSIELAYALTTHKTQGSEFQNVCYIMNKSQWYNLNRNNFYTGVTRARDRSHVISDQKSLYRSLGTLPQRGPQTFGGKKND
jgi:exodeoxyribonuclease V alpha subunit